MIDPNFVRFAIAEKTAQLALADLEARKRLHMEIKGLVKVLENEV